MSILTQSLEKIVNWLRVNDLESVSGLRPGLSDSKIEELTQSLPLLLPYSGVSYSKEELTQPFPLILPWEVREIYHYCNGNIALTPSLVLQPLELAIENTCYADWMRGKKIPSCSNILPLFQGDGKDFYYVICDGRKNDSSVWCVFVGREPLEYAASLTSLMLTVWECYKTGAYYIDVDEEGYSYVEEDFEKLEKVFQKYNPEQMNTWRYFWGD